MRGRDLYAFSGLRLAEICAKIRCRIKRLFLSFWIQVKEQPNSPELEEKIKIKMLRRELKC
jgi:hypothetical protein